MTLRSRLFIIISLIVLIVLGSSLFLIARGRKAAAPTSEIPGAPVSGEEGKAVPGATANNQIPATAAPAPTPAPAITAEQAEQNGVRLLAKVFIERFQSYSTDADFQNVKEIETMVTPVLWKRLASKITASPSSGPFVGVITEVIVSSLKDWSPPSAIVNVKTRTATEKNNIITRTYPEYTVTFVKTEKDWLVDSFVKQ